MLFFKCIEYQKNKKKQNKTKQKKKQKKKTSIGIFVGLQKKSQVIEISIFKGFCLQFSVYLKKNKSNAVKMAAKIQCRGYQK